MIFFSDIIHGYITAKMKKNYLRLLPFYMTVTTCFYYEKVHRTMHTAIVSYILKLFFLIVASFLENVENTSALKSVL